MHRKSAMGYDDLSSATRRHNESSNEDHEEAHDDSYAPSVSPIWNICLCRMNVARENVNLSKK